VVREAEVIFTENINPESEAGAPSAKELSLN
jgi:hypothetical protein